MNEQPVSRTGYDLINAPRWNKGTAFSDEERDVFSLHGLLPSHVGTLEEQIERRMRALRELPTAFENYAFLRDLQDTNERSRRTSGNRRTSRMREAPPARAATEGERVPAGESLQAGTRTGFGCSCVVSVVVSIEGRKSTTF